MARSIAERDFGPAFFCVRLPPTVCVFSCRAAAGLLHNWSLAFLLLAAAKEALKFPGNFRNFY